MPKAGRTKRAGTTTEESWRNNCKLGLIAYKIIKRDGSYTAFGRELYELRGDDEKLYNALARHILLNLNGMALVQCIQDMTVAGEAVNLTTLREGLAARGIHYPSGGKHPSMMRLWLAKAGVFVGGRWQVGETRLQQVLGTGQYGFRCSRAFQCGATGVPADTCEYRHQDATARE